MKVVCALLLAAAVSRGQKAPTSPEQDSILAEIRDYALHYFERLPDYTCIQRTQRDHDAIPYLWAKNDPAVAGKDPPHILSSELIEEELTFAGRKAKYKVVRINSAPAINVDHEQLGETVTADTFGWILSNTFDSSQKTKVIWNRFDRLRGRSTMVFAFAVSASQGFDVQDKSTGRGEALAYNGRVYIDTESKAVMRMDVHASGFPEDSYYQGIDFTLDYKGTRLDGRRVFLPDRFELHWRATSRPDSIHSRNTATKDSIEVLREETNTYGEFKTYRELSGTTSTSPLMKR